MPAPDRLRHLLLNEDGFAFDPASGLTYLLNASALRVTAWLKEGCAEEDLPGRLVEEYETDWPTAKRDVERFLANLRNYKLL